MKCIKCNEKIHPIIENGHILNSKEDKCEKCKMIEKYLDICNEILEDWDNDWCWDTIKGIRNWIEDNNHITENQMEAIANIKRKIDGE